VVNLTRWIRVMILAFAEFSKCWFNLAWYLLTCDCLSWILAFTVAKYDTTSKTDAVDFSIIWTCSIKATTNDCKCLNVNRIRSKNFQKERFRTKVGLSIDMKFVFEAGYNWSIRGKPRWSDSHLVTLRETSFWNSICTKSQ